MRHGVTGPRTVYMALRNPPWTTAAVGKHTTRVTTAHPHTPASQPMRYTLILAGYMAPSIENLAVCAAE